jgi:oligopeptidase B
VAVDDHHRPSKVFRHRLGTPPSADVLVYDEPDAGFFVGVSSTEDRRHLIIHTHDHTTSELWLLDAGRPEEDPRCIARRKPGTQHAVSAAGNALVFLTNDAAEDFRLAQASSDASGPESWQPLVPHRPGCLITAVVGFAEYLVRLEMRDALPHIVIRRMADGEEHEISFDEPAYSLGLIPGYEHDTHTLRFSYSSPTTPAQTFDYDMERRSRTLLKQHRIPSGHDARRFRSARVHATSEDGEQIPITLLWHEQTPLDGSAPLVLYGYGSYGHGIPAAFAENRLSLVERGFVYAIAHVRGGKEKGYAWYTSGKLMAKKNTFSDFIRCAEHLCETGYTSPGNITIHGGSAGGMLVGVAVNLRPELFRAVVAQVPFVDVLSTMSDGTLPLTPPEWPEWGNPLESEEAHDYIASYSPYDNVTARAYPHLLATAGLTDPRVTYWEPAKWIARLREKRTNDNLLLLRTYMEAGHGGAAGRFEKLD